MNKNIIDINGLIDSISVLEKNKNFEPSYQSDILYNEKEPINFETFAFEQEIKPYDFGEFEGTNLLSIENKN